MGELERVIQQIRNGARSKSRFPFAAKSGATLVTDNVPLRAFAFRSAASLASAMKRTEIVLDSHLPVRYICASN